MIIISYLFIVVLEVGRCEDNVFIVRRENGDCVGVLYLIKLLFGEYGLKVF